MQNFDANQTLFEICLWGLCRIVAYTLNRWYNLTEVGLARARVKNGKTDGLRAWFEGLRERESEVIETLQHEGIYAETTFILLSDETAYLHICMETKESQKADETGD